jgi:hypothetical protein
LIEAEQLARSPAWLPLTAAQDLGVRLVRLDEAAYRAASFLDQRLLDQGYPQGSCPVPVLEAAAARLSPQAGYIFHTGHAGSTLISRLVGAYPGFFSLREPALLRALAVGPHPETGTPALEVALALLSRTWSAGQRAVVKVTSFVSELAEPILASAPKPAAIFMFVHPRAYLCGILAGPSSRAEIRQLGAARRRRLEQRLGESFAAGEPRSEGEWVALSWLCEMTTLSAAAALSPAQVLWVEFDAFLSKPVAGLDDILRALGAVPEARELESLVTGPLMRRYSKAPEHAYDAALRRAVLQSAELEHTAEIRRGMQWLEQRAAGHALAQRAFEMSAAERL